mgnify:CR=1 FL=1
MTSDTSDNIIICISFTYNFPNPRGFDMVFVTPDKLVGVDKWEVCTKDDYVEELFRKMMSLLHNIEKELEEWDEIHG